jgi:GT2 family glycosyltransferase
MENNSEINKNVSILIVTHNHEKDILELVNSLIKFNYKNVYICDAASNDDTVKNIEKTIFKNNVLKKQTLHSFSKNNNDLIKQFNLTTKYYLLLNPDLYFNQDIVKEMYVAMESDEKIGVAATKLFYPNDKVQVSWKKFPNFFQVLKKRLGITKAIHETQMKAGEIDWCLGACMMISKKLLQDSKLLDERYRLYCEDIDICFKARVMGLKVVGIENCYAYHKLNEKSAKKIFSKYNYWNIASVIKFFVKWNVKYFKYL